MEHVYLLASSSYNVINTKIAEIASGNKNITQHSLQDVSIYDCLDDASYLGMFEGSRIIVIKDVKYFSGKYNYEDETKAILSFLQNRPDEITLIFVCDAISRTKDITKKVLELGASIFDMNDLSNEQISEYLQTYASNNDLLIDPLALKHILDNSLNNIDVALEEINKLAVVNKHITMDVVNTYGIRLTNVDIFAFSNAVIAKNYNAAFDILDELLLNGVDVFAIIGVLASSFTNMYMVKDALKHGLSDEEIAKKLGYAGTGRVYVLKKNSKIYTLEDLEEVVVSLADLDRDLKTGYNQVYKLKEFLLSL